MFEVFECLALAIKEKGIRGLCDLVPGGGYALDIASYAYRLYCERRKMAAIRGEIAKIAAASVADAKRTAEQVARQVVNEGPIEDRLTLELYLTQLPGTFRQSLKRVDDPIGKTVSPDFAIHSPEDFARILPSRMPHFRPGVELPRRPGWQLHELLGVGGFGEVWLVRHSLLPQPRAVKFCTDAKLRTKLTSHEGRVIARVMEQGTHPNVVPLLDALLESETPWLMYELIEGGCLTDLILRLQAFPHNEREAFTILSLSQLAAAISTFHQLSPAIVHRDLKPANILLSDVRDSGALEGGGSPANSHRPIAATLRITDFGIGGVVEHPSSSLDGQLLLTGRLETSLRGSYSPLYASPQQARGLPPDPRDDIHAIGVIAYQMFTGRLTEGPSPRFERELRRGGASDAFIELIGDCVDGDANVRPRDATEFTERLHRIAKQIPRLPQSAKNDSQCVPLSSSLADARNRTKSVATPLEGGSTQFTILPLAGSTEAEKWLIPLHGQWFSRSAEKTDLPWILSNTQLPGKVTIQPEEVYRFTLNPDTTDDEALANLKSLVGLPGLEAIDLSGCIRVTDDGLMHLGYLRGLRAIGLAHTQITDSGVGLLLTRFPELETISLAGTTNVSQSVVSHLMRLQKLKYLALPPCADTVEMRKNFAKRRPNCQLV